MEPSMTVQSRNLSMLPEWMRPFPLGVLQVLGQGPSQGTHSPFTACRKVMSQSIFKGKREKYHTIFSSLKIISPTSRYPIIRTFVGNFQLSVSMRRWIHYVNHNRMPIKAENLAFDRTRSQKIDSLCEAYLLVGGTTAYASAIVL